MGVGGYVGQAWWAKSMAKDYRGTAFVHLDSGAYGYRPDDTRARGSPLLSLEDQDDYVAADGIHPADLGQHNHRLLLSMMTDWETCPWYGRQVFNDVSDERWKTWLAMPRWPRSAYYELAKLLTGQDLPNDPDAWKAWFKAHPNLVWDNKQKRLVEPSATR